VEQRNAPKGGAIDAVIEFEMTVTATAKDGLGTIGEFGFVEAPPDLSLACAELVVQKAMAFARDAFALAADLTLAIFRLLA